MKNSTYVEWTGDMAFDAELNGHHIKMDASEQVGGHNTGPSPKGLLLVSLAGCTGMDVVSILKKMQVNNYKLKIEVEGELTEEHPKIYHTITVKFLFTGDDLPAEKLKRAVELSDTRYCGVSAMLKKAAEINVEIIVNGENI